MGGAPPTPTATLADVVGALQAIFTVLSDVHSDTISIDQKLLIMRNTLTDVHADTISIDQKLLRIRNAISPLGEDLPTQDRSSIVWSLYRIMDAIEPSYPGQPYTPVKIVLNQIYQLLSQMKSNGDAISNVLGTPPPGDEFTFATLLQRIAARTGGAWESLGVLSSPAAGTVLQLLACICDAEQQQLPTNPLDPTDPDSCAEPFISTGMLVSVTNPNVLVATWEAPLPSGITFHNPGYGGMLSNTNWSGWRMFVASKERQFSWGIATDLQRHPTNQWIPFPDGAGDYEWSVSTSGDIKVYLCSPESSSDCAPIPDQPDSSWVDTGHVTFNPSNGTIWGGSGTNRIKVGFNANAANGATVEVRCNGNVIDTVQLTGTYTWHAYSVGNGAVLDYNIINPNSYVDWYPAAVMSS